MPYSDPPYRYRVRSRAVKRLGLQAVRLLSEAYCAADEDPIEPTALHKMALGYLMLTGCCSPDHVRLIWSVLRHEAIYAQKSCRQAYFGNVLDSIKRRVEKLGTPESKSGVSILP